MAFTCSRAASIKEMLIGGGAIRVIRLDKLVAPLQLCQENERGGLPLHYRGRLLLCLFVGIAIFGWVIWRSSLSRRQQSESPTLTIEKQPVVFANHTFDPNSPPADMPALAYGEQAACDSNFSSTTTVGGKSQKIDATHATVTVTKVRMILHLSINIWVPSGATQNVVEHEDGHRQISQYYYQAADKLAERLAATYLGRTVDISGTDIDDQFEKALHQMATDITKQYDTDIGVAAAQQYYDLITDHGRNNSDVRGAVAAAIENTKIVSIQ